MAINVTLPGIIPSEESFYHVDVDNSTGVRVITGLIPIGSEESFYTPAIGSALTDQFIYMPLIASEESFYTPTLSYNQDVTVTAYIASEESVYQPTLNGVRVTGYIASAESIPSPTINSAVGLTINSFIDDSLSEVFEPTLTAGAVAIQPTAVIASAESVPNPTIKKGAVAITPSTFIQSFGYFFTPTINISQARPIVIRLAHGGMNGGDITQNNAAPRLSYYSIPDNENITYDRLLYTESLGMLPDYISSSDALFSGQFYTGFYIYNSSSFASSVATGENLNIWVNGGESFTVSNTATPKKAMYENTPYLDKVKNQVGGNYDAYNRGGSSYTSMLDQTKIELFVSPAKKLVEFDDSGFSIGLNLARQRFTPANEKIKLPSLKPGEYVGVYMRVTTQFNPDLGIPLDYAFLHLSYISGGGYTREGYPGQLSGITTGSTPQTLFLPSIVLKFVTNYDKILTEVGTEVDTLYSKYPPYFTYYEGS